MNRVNGILALGLGGLAAAWFVDHYTEPTIDEAGNESWTVHDIPLLGEAVGLVDDVIGTVTGNADVQGMRPSWALQAMLKKSESLMLTRTNRGDGGWTIGWGRYEKFEHLLPAQVSRAEADAMFEIDLEQRAARWVRAYVKVPLTQEQFDALCSMAYNLSPPSFRNIANAVNRGEGPEAQAMRYLGPPRDHRGVTNRRNREFALYNNGVYA